MKSEVGAGPGEAGEPQELIGLGMITRPHGIRGEVRVHPYWAEGTTLEEVDHVWLRKPDAEDSAPHQLEVLSVRPANRVLLVQFGCVDRNEAERLRGFEVCIPRKDMPPLGPDEYYLVDLLGARVTCAGELVGSVVELRTHPSVDAVIIRKENGKLVEQVLAEPWIARVDTAEKLVELSSLEGLI